MTPVGTIDGLVGELVRLFRYVLRDQSVDENTDILDAGGSSLTAVRLVAHIREELGRDVDLADILDHGTPRRLAAVVASAPEWDDDDI